MRPSELTAIVEEIGKCTDAISGDVVVGQL